MHYLRRTVGEAETGHCRKIAISLIEGWLARPGQRVEWLITSTMLRVGKFQAMFRRCAPLQHLNLYVLCLREDGSDTGPHSINQEELRAAFNTSNGWNVATIEPDRI